MVVLSLVSPPTPFFFFLNECFLCHTGLPWWPSGKEPAYQCRRRRFDPWVGKIPWRRKWQPTPVLLLGKSYGQRSLVGYSPRGCKVSDMNERLHFLSFLVSYRASLVAQW